VEEFNYSSRLCWKWSAGNEVPVKQKQLTPAHGFQY